MRTQACKSLGWSFSIQNVVLVPAISASPEVYWAFLKSQSKSMYQNLQVTYRGYSLRSTAFSSVQFSCSVVSDSLWPHESQHARPPYPSPTPWIHSDSRPSSQWCHPAISSSVIPFSSCPQSLPASVFSNESTLRTALEELKKRKRQHVLRVVCVCALLQPHGLYQAPLSMRFASKECHFLLQGIFLAQGLNPHPLHGQASSLPLNHLGSPLRAVLRE